MQRNIQQTTVKPAIAMLAALLIGSTMLAGCTTVNSDYDAHATISRYRTYVLEEVSHRAPDAAAFANPLNEKRLRAAVESNLAVKGLQPVAVAPAASQATPTHDSAKPDSAHVAGSASADCIVRISTSSRQRLGNDRGPVSVGFGWGWFHHGYGSSLSFDNDVYAYDDYRISIDLIDAKTQDPVWHVSVNEDINRLSGVSAEMRINAVVAEMFKKFP